MIRRREFITLVGGTAVAWPLAARTQETLTAAPIVGLVSIAASAADAGNFRGFLEQMRELGHGPTEPTSLSTSASPAAAKS